MHKKILSVAIAALGMCLLPMSCSRVKDIDERLDSLENRVGAIETQLTKMNSDINALSKIVNALQQNLYIYKVNDLPGGMEFIFSDGSRATIYDGEDGAEGKAAPVIGVKAQGGVYYWTMTYDGITEWLTDDQGRMMRVTGEKGDTGEDGVTPQMGVDAQNCWTVSVDGGLTWKQVLDPSGNPVQATGEKGEKGDKGEQGANGKDGVDGEDGDSFFDRVELCEDYVLFVLADGTQFEIPYKSQLDKLVARIQKIDVVPNHASGGVWIKTITDNEFNFLISPDSLASKLLEGFKANKTSFILLATKSLTKAATFDTIRFATTVTESGGVLTFKVDGKQSDNKFCKNFYTACLQIKDSVNCSTSGFFPLARPVYPGLPDSVCITVGTTTWAPVNCGYDAVNYPYGKLYQWGRHDGGGYNDGGTYKEIVLQTVADGPVDASGEDAAKFYKNTVNPCDWLSSQNDRRWNSGTEASPQKTAYDPCPTGWRVPTKEELTVLIGTHRSGGLQDGTGVHAGMKGKWFDGSTTAEPTSGVFLPAAGLRRNNDETANRGSSGCYWLSSVGNEGKAKYLDFYSNGLDEGSNVRADGMSVRCVQE